MEAVPATLPAPIPRFVVPEVVVDARAFSRRALVISSTPRDSPRDLARSYLPEPAGATGLLVDVYG